MAFLDELLAELTAHPFPFAGVSGLVMGLLGALLGHRLALARSRGEGQERRRNATARLRADLRSLKESLEAPVVHELPATIDHLTEEQLVILSRVRRTVPPFLEQRGCVARLEAALQPDAIAGERDAVRRRASVTGGRDAAGVRFDADIAGKKEELAAAKNQLLAQREELAALIDESLRSAAAGGG